MRGRSVIALIAAGSVLAACDNQASTGNSGGGAAPDPALRRVALEARPLIDGLERCRARYGSFPPNPEATMGCLPRGAPMRRQAGFVVVGDWTISPDPTGVGYTMTKQLDARAMLVRHCGRRACRWIYDPGDGRISVEMNLGA
ncbi:MAG: hypothetical protein GC190_12355 [Alphaproteobacteria bacterium]|nr:hypothetical protein [Alphaproteobacteria bacterium]